MARQFATNFCGPCPAWGRRNSSATLDSRQVRYSTYQLVRAERLLEHGFGESVAHVLFAVARHIQHTHLALALAENPHELRTAHLSHAHIADHELDARVLVPEPDGIRGAMSEDDHVALAFQA